jgi:hypothetical protein
VRSAHAGWCRSGSASATRPDATPSTAGIAQVLGKKKPRLGRGWRNQAAPCCWRASSTCACCRACCLVACLRTRWRMFITLLTALQPPLPDWNRAASPVYELMRLRRIALSLIFKVPPGTHGSSENCWTLCLDQIFDRLSCILCI